jgi:hypothetical protein
LLFFDHYYEFSPIELEQDKIIMLEMEKKEEEENVTLVGESYLH